MKGRNRRPARPPRRRQTRVPPHAFLPGESFTDHLGHTVVYCAACKVAGEQGDARHPDGALPAMTDDARRVQARMLGESYE